MQFLVCYMPMILQSALMSLLCGIYGGRRHENTLFFLGANARCISDRESGKLQTPSPARLLNTLVDVMC
jgi:hypothetical protein